MESNLFKRHQTFTKFEFWAFMTAFVFGLYFFVTNTMTGDGVFEREPYKSAFEEANVPYSYYIHYFIPQLVHHLVRFTAFMFLNFIIIPRILQRQSVLKNLLILVFIFFITGVMIRLANSYLLKYLFATSSQGSANYTIFMKSLEDTAALFMMLVIYTLIKYTGLYLLSMVDTVHKTFKYVTREAIVATIIWLVVLLLMLAGRTEVHLVIGWMVIIPNAILFYSYALHKLIPAALINKRPFRSYLLKSTLVIIFSIVLVYIFALAMTSNDPVASRVTVLNTVFQLFVIAPLSWFVYKRYQHTNEAVAVLQKELKQSTANIDQLRSQINPHFLFNALNTLYGTAIQENAARTSEGIQKLGDMMRFMLQENMQEKISLSRDVEYLENYIELQKLRTNNNPHVQIQTNIHSQETMLQIAPMLLIPFVENAFKHGISFREASHININLDTKDKTLYFDVYNSKHIRQHNDPEKDKSGIGLENVRQRLLLLYPNKHELTIRDTERQFFIHLTIQLA